MKEYSYKESGIEWLGEIPEHWNVDRIKDLCLKIVSGGTPKSSNSDYWDEGDIIWLSPTDFTNQKQQKYIADSEKKITKLGLLKSSAKLLPKDTVIMSSRASIGEVKIAAKELSTNQGFISFIPYKHLLDYNFYYYIIDGHLGQYFEEIASGTTFKEIGKTTSSKEPIPLPPLPEQKTIADYLDAACQKIDRVIELKEKQIEAMKSHLASKFHEVLTKGIRNKELNDSHINWMGDMPKSWERKRLKDILHLKSGDGITSTDISPEGEYPVYGGNGLRGYTNSFTHEGFFPLIGRQVALCGNINYASGKFWASEHAVVATPTRKINVYWAGELMRVMNLNQYSNAAAQPGLAVEKIKNLYIPYPEFEEQNEIADYLKGYETKVNRSISTIEKQIIILKNYRKSLIHECVTGKKRVYEGDLPVEAEVA